MSLSTVHDPSTAGVDSSGSALSLSLRASALEKGEHLLDEAGVGGYVEGGTEEVAREVGFEKHHPVLPREGHVPTDERYARHELAVGLRHQRDAAAHARNAEVSGTGIGWVSDGMVPWLAKDRP